MSPFLFSIITFGPQPLSALVRFVKTALLPGEVQAKLAKEAGLAGPPVSMNGKHEGRGAVLKDTGYLLDVLRVADHVFQGGLIAMNLQVHGQLAPRNLRRCIASERADYAGRRALL